MSSVIDIANLALSKLGDSATVSSINPPEGSAQAEHCQRFYPIARDSLLELHSWNFATKRVVLAQLTDTPPDAWAYVYAAPSDYIRALSLIPSGAASEADTMPFVIETNVDGTLVIFTNVSEATLKYISQVTDTNKFTPLFVNTLATLLASYLAGPVIKGSEGLKIGDAMFNKAMQLLSVAGGKDSSARSYDAQKSHVPSWIHSYGVDGNVNNVFDADGRIIR